MKLKSLYSTFIAIFIAFYAISCDDNVTEIGKTIQPEPDNIAFEIDSVSITAETVSIRDYIYVDNENILLGEVDDPIFGKLKADVLAEFYSGGGANATFKLGYDDEATIDSVRLEFEFKESNFMGNKKKPMTISVYEVSEELKTNYYTNIDPKDYCDLKTILGQRFFSFDNLYSYNYTNSSTGATTKYVMLDIDLEKSYGERLYNKWKENKNILNNPKELKDFTKGIYVTTDFNNNGIFEISNINETMIAVIYYSYKLKKVNEPDVDSTAVGYLPLPMGYDVNKLNRVVNTSWDEIKNIAGNTESSERTLIKAPAGVVTELTIPLEKIRSKGKSKMGNDDFTVNSAIFKLTGLTEEEEKLNITKRPDFFLVINKDSLYSNNDAEATKKNINDFFIEKKMPNHTTSLIMVRDASNNTYSFSNQGTISSSYLTNNLSTTINYYLTQKNEDGSDIKELKLLVIPVSASVSGSSNSNLQVASVENLLQPAAAILRTNEKNMTMSLAFSRHNDIE